MDRRGFLKFTAGGGIATIAGIRILSDSIDQIHRLRGVNTPLQLVVHNSSDHQHSVSLRIELNAELLYEESINVGPNESAGITEFRRAGRYSAFAESNGMRAEFEDMLVTWEQLASCNSLSLIVRVGDDQLSTAILHTELGCNSLLFGQ